MAEETETTTEIETAADVAEETTEETTTEETVTEPLVADFLNPDGTFKEGWVEALTPEDFRSAGDKLVYGTVSGLKDALKRLAHQQRTIRKQGKGVMPLGKEPTATEVELYRAAMGVPETPEGYNIETPEGLGEYFDDAMIKESGKVYHDAHLTPAQVTAIVDLDAKRLREGIEEQEALAATAREETEEALRKEWPGETYDEKLRLANRVIAENVSEEDEEAVLAIIGNDVKVAKLFAKLGAAFLEDKTVSTDGGQPSTVTSEIDRLQVTPGYANGELRRTNRKEHDRIVARLAVLYARKFPEPAPTT